MAKSSISGFPQWVKDLVAEKFDWEGRGKYWISERRGNICGGQLELGFCHTPAALKMALAEVINMGEDGPEESWENWHCGKE